MLKVANKSSIFVHTRKPLDASRRLLSIDLSGRVRRRRRGWDGDANARTKYSVAAGCRYQWLAGNASLERVSRVGQVRAKHDRHRNQTTFPPWPLPFGCTLADSLLSLLRPHTRTAFPFHAHFIFSFDHLSPSTRLDLALSSLWPFVSSNQTHLNYLRFFSLPFLAFLDPVCHPKSWVI